ncbi:AI-2E family transporter [Kitasatospora sp. NBC_00240]|uniref:AI-2E family transporter n=1 Tax=Kitasatospora sp. NBC_00240 TaxID=2903567 RepID=UPI0022597C29|nr:AI-2E family transporter [Kitasatospora sp. NBC_00240]MCX5215028.1 AI-2E family transporter [Kitasatospora sp. NBC_00240]
MTARAATGQDPEPDGRPDRRRPRAGTPATRRPVVRGGAPSGHQVPPGLEHAAGYAWRLLLVGATVYAVLSLLGRLVLPVIAVFVALVITAVLRPAADLINRWLPRGAAVAVTVLGSILLLAGLLALIGENVAGEWKQLGDEFRGGVDRIELWLKGAPFHIKPATVSDLQSKISSFLTEHRSTLVSRAVNEASRVVEIVTGAALALFCSIFFIHSGEGMWRWAKHQLPHGARETWDHAGRAAWRTFAGYTRGIMIVAASNAALVGIALALLGVPLALPLTVLEFFATLVPLIGSPVAMAIAAVVALAAKGPVTALIVLALIVVIGQIEGHLLHPLVMSWAVRLHPVAVALSVIAGGILAGVIGAVVAVPVVSVVWAVICELRLRREAARRPAAP